MPKHRPRHRSGEGCAKCDSERERLKLKMREKRASKPRAAHAQPKKDDRIAVIDGEAIEGKYCLLQAMTSDGQLYTLKTDGRQLSTRECFDFLNRLPRVIFSYSFGYDVSFWLHDVPPEFVRCLHDYQQARLPLQFGGGRILRYIPGKAVMFTDCSRAPGDRERRMYDLYPYCQGSFISALESWGIPVPPIVRELKAKRDAFSASMASRIEEYNVAELDAMLELVKRIQAAFGAIDALPKRDGWYGPGAHARVMMEKQGVQFRPYGWWVDGREEEGTWQHAVERAFFGGRFELSLIGCVDAAYEYDLTSAYPHALTCGMPCYAVECGGEWVHLDRYDERERWAIWRVVWRRRRRRKEMWGPLPYRSGRGLAWPTDGCSWIHGEELQAAMRYFPQYEYHVFEGWAWRPGCNHDPFQPWVRELAQQRVRLKQVGEKGSAQGLKLCLNSLYGKLRDQAGTDKPPVDEEAAPIYFVRGSDEPRSPTTYNPYIAGLITARTRARIIEAIAMGGEDIIYVATDAVHSRRPLPGLTAVQDPTAAVLGGWEQVSFGAPAVFMTAGNYAYADGPTKTRGINRELAASYEQMVEWVHSGQTEIEVPNRKFLSVRAADSLCRKGSADDYDRIKNTWIEKPNIVRLDLEPRREYDERQQRWVAPSANAYERRKFAIDALSGGFSDEIDPEDVTEEWMERMD